MALLQDTQSLWKIPAPPPRNTTMKSISRNKTVASGATAEDNKPTLNRSALPIPIQMSSICPLQGFGKCTLTRNTLKIYQYLVNQSSQLWVTCYVTEVKKNHFHGTISAIF